MHGIFIAWGPAFKQGVEVGPVRNVDIHPVIMNLLGLMPPGETDSDPAALTQILE